jgi:8-oxo-dGTP diphosphatase
MGFPRCAAMTEVVCGVIADDAGRFLACLRPAGKHLGGMWEFPGGKVESGESQEDALVRELREELGIDVEVEAALDPVEWTYDRGPIRLLPFLCHIIRGIPHPLEHEALRWCAPCEFGNLEWAPADLPVLDQLHIRETSAAKS